MHYIFFILLTTAHSAFRLLARSHTHTHTRGLQPTCALSIVTWYVIPARLAGSEATTQRDTEWERAVCSLSRTGVGINQVQQYTGVTYTYAINANVCNVICASLERILIDSSYDCNAKLPLLFRKLFKRRSHWRRRCGYWHGCLARKCHNHCKINQKSKRFLNRFRNVEKCWYVF